jgi:Domain of unknown function (DUF4411)
MTLYLLDANVLIRAHEDYYPVDRIPPFWSWLIEMGEAGTIKVPRLIWDELTPPPGPLAEWLKREDVKSALILSGAPDTAVVQRVLNEGYAPDLNDVEVEEIGKDPFLIAVAMAAADRTVVTRETSAPSKKREKRKVPDVCDYFRVRWLTDFKLYQELDFSIR